MKNQRHEKHVVEADKQSQGGGAFGIYNRERLPDAVGPGDRRWRLGRERDIGQRGVVRHDQQGKEGPKICDREVEGGSRYGCRPGLLIEGLLLDRGQV